VRIRVAALQQSARQTIAATDAQAQRREAVLVGTAASAILASFAMIALLAVRRRRAARASGDLLSSVLDNAPVGLGFLDGDLRIRHLNLALTTMSEGYGTSCQIYAKRWSRNCGRRWQRGTASRTSRW